MKRNLLKIIFVFSTIFMFVCTVNARSYGLVDNSPVQEGEYDSIRFLAGNTATNKAKVDGLSFIAGNNILAQGEVEYGFYAGNLVSINEKVNKDAFAAGNSITFSKSASVGRDAFIAASNVVINAEIARDVNVGAEIVDLRGATIGGWIKVEADRIILDSNTVIKGKLKYNENAVVEGLELASVGSVETYVSTEVDVEEETMTFSSIVTDFILSYGAAVLTLIVLFLLIPVVAAKLDKEKVDKTIVNTSLIGLGMLCVLPVVVIITLFTGLLTPVALIVLALYVIFIYLSSLFASYVIGRLLMNKLFKKDNMYLAILVGVLAFKLVGIIPIIGGLVKFVALVYGLGLIYNYFVALRALKAKK